MWTEHERGDRRLWRQHGRHDELAAYWQRIATRYRHRPNVVGYELLNEPCPEEQSELEVWSRDTFIRFAENVRGTPADLNLLYRRLIRSVREVDPMTPIILDSGAWASPASFVGLEPIPGDEAVLYSFHWYAPEPYTNWRENSGRHAYPGCVTMEPGGGEQPVETIWGLGTHRERMAEPVRQWQSRYQVPSKRILCGEFSADRRVAGADAWNADVIRVLEENGWHWTFYAFRERDWSAKDFELGSDPMCTTRSATEMMATFSRAMTSAANTP